LKIDIKNEKQLLANFQPKSWEKTDKSLILEERVYNPKASLVISKLQILDDKGKWHKSVIITRLYSLARPPKFS